MSNREYFLLVVFFIVAATFAYLNQNAKKASAEVKQEEVYHVTEVSYKDGLVITNNTRIMFQKGEATHVFEIDLDGGKLVKYNSIYDDKKHWTELRFDNDEALSAFTNILRKYGRDVGFCYSGALHHCTVFLF